MMDPALFSSDRQDWETPPWLFNLLDTEFHFDLDCACTSKNRLGSCVGFEHDKGADALTESWWRALAPFRADGHTPAAFINPPYGKGGVTGKWIHKTWAEALHGFIYVMLIAARTDTKAWHEIIFKHAKEIRFIKGRVIFNLNGKPKINAKTGHIQPAGFPSAVVVFQNPKLVPRRRRVTNITTLIQPEKVQK